MDSENLERLEALRKRNADPEWVNHDLYRLLYKPDLFIIAYERIKSNPGNMTEGGDGTTLDGFSMIAIENIIKALRDESFKFSPARRVPIPKANGGQRLLNVASPREKVVQDAVRMILEAIYDSPHGATFHDESHGFRPGRSCHTALKAIRSKRSGVNWVIEGDIKACFDEVDHDVLIGLLRKRIDDERFLNLIRKSLKAGHFESRVPVNSLSGTPQGSVISPILANVYLHELDGFVKGLQAEHERGEARKPNPAYRKLARRRAHLREKGDPSHEIRQLEKELRRVPSLLPDDPDFVRVKYVRYADDWMVGVTGPKELAAKLRQEVADFLAERLKLRLNFDKTHVRHAKTEEAFFLGTRIKFGGGEPKQTVTKRGDQTFKRRSTGWTARMFAPIENIVRRLHDKGFCTPEGKPNSKVGWTVLDDDQIIRQYDAVLRGILNYYSFVNNFGSLTRIQYVLHYSAAKTLAHRHRTKVRKTFKKLGRSPAVRSSTDPNKLVRLNPQSDWSSRPNRFLTGSGPSDVLALNVRLRTRSKLESNCVICGSDDRVAMHHVRHVRKMGQRTTGFNKVMAILNRKQIPVCHDCHRNIHCGKYDGLGLGDFADPQTARR